MMTGKSGMMREFSGKEYSITTHKNTGWMMKWGAKDRRGTMLHKPQLIWDYADHFCSTFSTPIWELLSKIWLTLDLWENETISQCLLFKHLRPVCVTGLVLYLFACKNQVLQLCINLKGIDRPFRGGVESILILSLLVNWRLGYFFYHILKGLLHKISKKPLDAA
jgi:hypothetical protein